MSDIFNEVDEALKQDRVEQWWQENGKMVVWFCFCLVFFTAVITFGRQWMETNRGENTAMLLSVVEQGGISQNLNAANLQIPEGATPEDISKILNEQSAQLGTPSQGLLDYAEKAPSGLSMLARFQAAQLAFDKGNVEEAVTILDDLHNDGDVDTLYADYALLLKVMKQAELLGVEGSDLTVTTLADALQDLDSDKNPWISSMLELRGLLYAKDGQVDLAKADFQRLQSLGDAPYERRERAQKLSHVLTHNPDILLKK